MKTGDSTLSLSKYYLEIKLLRLPVILIILSQLYSGKAFSFHDGLAHINPPYELVENDSEFKEGTITRLSETEMKRFLPWANNAKNILIQAMEDIQNMPLHEQVYTLKTKIQEVVRSSKTRSYQTLMRFGLNRGLLLLEIYYNEVAINQPGVWENALDLLKNIISVSLEFYQSDLAFQKNISTFPSDTSELHAVFGINFHYFAMKAIINVSDVSAQFYMMYKAYEMLSWDLSRDKNALDYSENILEIYNYLKKIKKQSPSGDKSYLQAIRGLSSLSDLSIKDYSSRGHLKYLQYKDLDKEVYLLEGENCPKGFTAGSLKPRFGSPYPSYCVNMYHLHKSKQSYFALESNKCIDGFVETFSDNGDLPLTLYHRYLLDDNVFNFHVTCSNEESIRSVDSYEIFNIFEPLDSKKCIDGHTFSISISDEYVLSYRCHKTELLTTNSENYLTLKSLGCEPGFIVTISYQNTEVNELIECRKKSSLIKLNEYLIGANEECLDEYTKTPTVLYYRFNCIKTEILKNTGFYTKYSAKCSGEYVDSSYIDRNKCFHYSYLLERNLGYPNYTDLKCKEGFTQSLPLKFNGVYCIPTVKLDPLKLESYFTLISNECKEGYQDGKHYEADNNTIAFKKCEAREPIENNSISTSKCPVGFTERSSSKESELVCVKKQ